MRGVKDISPILLGALPFGLVVGVVSAEISLTSIQTFAESALIFAGASQLVMLDLLDKDAALWVIVLSAGILNLRHVIYSASIAPHYKKLSPLWKAVLSFVMVDQVYALGIAHHTANPNAPFKHYYHMGLALTIGAVWLAGTMVGYFLGAMMVSIGMVELVFGVVFVTVLALTYPDVPWTPLLVGLVLVNLVVPVLLYPWTKTAWMGLDHAFFPTTVEEEADALLDDGERRGGVDHTGVNRTD